MEVKVIKDPIDIIYPFDDVIFNNPAIVYHGTCSGFSNLIEETGWQINSPPYNFHDVNFICDCYDSLDIQNNVYGTLKAFTLGISNGETKFPRFTKNYWVARGYAIHKCGETISNIMKGSEELLIEKGLSENKKRNLRKLRRKYGKLTQNTFSVVYVILVNPSWFSNWISADPDEPNTDLILIENLNPEHIQAKVEFHCEIVPFRPDYKKPLPLFRSLDSFKKHLHDSKYIDNLDRRILEKYSVREII